MNPDFKTGFITGSIAERKKHINLRNEMNELTDEIEALGKTNDQISLQINELEDIIISSIEDIMSTIISYYDVGVHPRFCDVERIRRYFTLHPKK